MYILFPMVVRGFPHPATALRGTNHHIHILLSDWFEQKVEYRHVHTILEKSVKNRTIGISVCPWRISCESFAIYQVVEILYICSLISPSYHIHRHHKSHSVIWTYEKVCLELRKKKYEKSGDKLKTDRIYLSNKIFLKIIIIIIIIIIMMIMIIVICNIFKISSNNRLWYEGNLTLRLFTHKLNMKTHLNYNLFSTINSHYLNIALTTQEL
jgi:hypothetical protein